MASPALAQDNLIAYGDFESFATGEVAPSAIFAGYNEDDGASTTYSIVDTEAVSGSQSLSVEYGGGAANFYQVQNFQPVTVTPGAEYTFSFQAKTDAADGSASIAYAVNVDQFGDNLGVAYEQPVTTDWQTYEITFTAPEGVTTVSGILQFGYANNVDGAVYVDDLSVVAAEPPPPNLIAYGDFEGFTPGETAPADIFTTFNGGADFATYSIVDTEAVSGSQSLSVQYNGGATNFYDVQNFQSVTVTPGAEYTFSFQAKTDAADGSASIAYAVNANTFSPNIDVVYEAAVTTDWQTYEITFTVPEGVTTVSGILQFGYANNVDGAVYIDDLSVVLIAEPDPIEPGEDGDYQASLSGANEVDPVDTPAMGSAVVTVNGTTVTVEGSFSGLSSAYAASHIHRGAAGTNGPVEITLSAVVSEGTSGVWNASENTFTVTQALADSIKSGLAYINVHSADNPGGEIRGQIVSRDGNGSLIVTGVFDGPLTGGVPKVVELYVLEDIEDLSRYAFGSANNGGGSDGAEFTFPEGSASAGEFISIATETDDFTSYFGEAPDYTSDAAGINGDDAIEVFFDADDNGDFAGGEVIDVFGDINTDGSGEAWDYLDGWAYRTDATGPDGSTFVIDNWTFSGIDVNDDQTSNATATTPFPYQTYVAAPMLTTIAEARTAGPGETVTVEGTVTRTAGAFTYIQDATGGLVIRQTNDDEDDDDFFDNVGDGTIAPGTMLRVIGTLSEFNQLLQINEDDLVSYEVLGDGAVPDPQTVTLAELAANGEDYEGELVTVNGVSFTDTGSFTAATTYQVTDDSDATNTVVVRVPNAGDTTVDDTPIPARANLTAVVGQFDSDSPTEGYQLLLLDADDVANSVANEGGGEVEMSLAVPNPIRQSATVRFTLDAPGEASLMLYDALGRKVATLAEGEMTVGVQTARLDAASLASGVYVLRLQAGDATMTRTITVVR